MENKSRAELERFFYQVLGRYKKYAKGGGLGRGIAADIQRASSPGELLRYPRGASFFQLISGLWEGDAPPTQKELRRLSRAVFLLPVVADTTNVKDRLGIGKFLGNTDTKASNSINMRISQICAVPGIEMNYNKDMKSVKSLMERVLKEKPGRQLNIIQALLSVYFWGDSEKERVYSDYHSAVIASEAQDPEDVPDEEDGTEDDSNEEE